MMGNDHLDSISDAAELNVMEGPFFGICEVSPSSHCFCLVDAQWTMERNETYE
jgi:hypothetical protein